MIEIVKATCPSCRRMLRIPGDWIEQPMRCKHCRMLFQGRHKKVTPLPEVVAAATAITPAPVVGMPTASPAAPVTAALAVPAAQEVPVLAPLAPVAQPPVAPVTAVTAAAAYDYPQYTPVFDFGADPGPAVAAATVPDQASTPTPRQRKQGSGWWKPAALGGLAAVIMVVAVLIAGGNLKGVFSARKKSDGGATLVKVRPDYQAPPPAVKTPESPPAKTGNPPPKVEPKAAPPKNDMPKSDTPRKDPPKVEPKVSPSPEPKALEGYFPRRALLISVNNYLFANSLHYGSPQTDRPAYPGSSTSVLARQLSVRPFWMPATQITELSDGSYSADVFGYDEKRAKEYGRTPHSTLKNVIETTMVDFLINSRPQDRVLLFFAGHAIDGENDAYLVPLEGDLENPKTLIPLSWVYEQLAKCKARQKLFILDVCRFPPARGFELPAGGPMGEMLDAKLQNPPPGVQVWSSCIKEQESLEFEKGSLFLQALCACLQERTPGIQKQTDPLPAEDLIVRVNQYMKTQLDAQKLTQTSRLVGTAPADGASFDPSVPLPDKLVLRPPLLPSGAEVADAALVEGVLSEIEQIPPVRASRRGVENRILRREYLPPFAAPSMAPFKSDMTLEAVKNAIKADPTSYPLRAATLAAIKALADNSNFVMRETLSGGGGPISPKVKEEFLKMQEDPGIAVFELERAFQKLSDAGKERDKESSKRWQANYDYTLARLLSRLVYTYEYNFMLAQVRSDSLPALEPVHNGWRIGSRDKPQIREDKVRDYTRTIRSIWTKIKEEYPSTPWETMARREGLIALGLEWRASRD